MLDPGLRYRCTACGNLTRFDETATRRTRRFLHFDLAGEMRVEDDEVLEELACEVICRWCGPSAVVETVPVLHADTP